MKGQELREQFTEEFFEEFQYDGEFRSIFRSMEQGLTPYQAIEHLCKSKKELLDSLEKAIENTPRKIVITAEGFEQIIKANGLGSEDLHNDLKYPPE